jgi:hypothetical protein
MTDAVSVATIAAVPSMVAAIAALIGAKQGKQNSHNLKRIEHQTNGMMDDKIRSAVISVFAEHRGEVTEAVMAESVRHLLNAIINENKE